MNIKNISAFALLVMLLAVPTFAQNANNVTYPAVPVEINEFNRSNETYQGIQSSLNANTPGGGPEIAAGNAGNNSGNATGNATSTPSAGTTPGFDAAFALTGILSVAGLLAIKKR